MHVVIIGLTRRDMEPEQKRLFEYENIKGEPEETRHKALTAYLFGVSEEVNRHRVVKDAPLPISKRPKMELGVKMVDNGHYTFLPEQKIEFLASEPQAKSLFYKYIGGKEYINAKLRWCLGFENVSPHILRNLPKVLERIRLVKEFRQNSKKSATRKLSQTPTDFECGTIPKSQFLVIPNVSSERRKYIPIGWMYPPTIPNQKLRVLLDATLSDFAILTSTMHMAWMRAITGRMKSDYMYSVGVVYNTFPWPTISPKQEAKISDLAQAILDARDQFPESTLADLYDPDLMPPPLRRAHTALDKAVDRLYRPKAFESERQRVEHLFMLYEKMVAPIEAAAKAKPKRARKAKKLN
ncbi:MAG: hypothetical protein L3J21_12735 [Devosiaceae bacterium]|nr:hypothetical protein [Devosiaceae bacterium]